MSGREVLPRVLAAAVSALLGLACMLSGLADAVAQGNAGAATDVAIDDRNNVAVVLPRTGPPRLEIVDLVDWSIQTVALPAKPVTVGVDSSRGIAVVGINNGRLYFLDIAKGELLPDPVQLRGRFDRIVVDSSSGMALAIGSPRGEVAVVDVSVRQLVQTLSINANLVSLAVHEAHGLAYVLSSPAPGGNSSISVLDLASLTWGRSIDIPGKSADIALDSELGLAVIVGDNSTITVVDLATGLTHARAATGEPYERVVLQPRSHLAVLLSKKGDTLSLLDLSSGTLTEPFASAERDASLDVSARHNLAFVSGRNGFSTIQLPSSAPQLNWLEPQEVYVGSEGFALRLAGEGFYDGAKVHFGDRIIEARWDNHGSLYADIPVQAFHTAGELLVSVTNPEPTPGPSASLPFRVRAPNPVPRLDELAPARIELADPAVAERLVARGAGFVPESILFLGGQDLETEYHSESELSALIPAALLAQPGTVPVTVYSPPVGGGTSNALTLSLESAGPRIEGFSPAEGPVGTTVVITGRNFDALSAANNHVTFDGAPALVARASENRLEVVVPLAAGTGPVSVETATGIATSDNIFTVLHRENFDIQASAESLQLPQGGFSSVVVSLQSLGLQQYAQLVGLQFIGLPPGIETQLDYERLSLNRPVTVTYTGEASPGTYRIKIVASGIADGELITREIEVDLIVLPPSATTLAGRVLHSDGDRPFVGARIRLGDQHVFTDASGSYLFVDPALTGDQVILIDGSTANTPEYEYASGIAMPVMIQPGHSNRALTSYMSAVDTSNFTRIVPGQTATVTNPEIPNYSLNIPDGAVLMGWDDKPIDKINVRMIPPDRLPIRPLPEGITVKSVYLYYFFREGGAEPSEPIPVTMVNDLGLLPGEKAVLWYYDESPTPDPDSNQWRVMGMGTVSDDGTKIVSDPGVGIPRFCCGATAPSPAEPQEDPPGGDGEECQAGNPVDIASGNGSVMDDHSVGLNGLFPVRVSCRYSSTTRRQGPFGLGTWMNYEWRAFAANTSVTIATPNGIRYTLVRDEDGVYRAQAGRARGLGMELTRSGNQAFLRLASGNILEFSIGGGGDPFRTLLMALENPQGQRIQLHRESSLGESNGRVIAITDGNGRQFRIDYASAMRISAITDPLGRSTSFDYDTQGRLVRVTDPAGQTTEYTWNADDRIVAKRDTRGHTTHYSYDDRGRTTHQILRDDSEYRFEYNTVGNTVTATHVTNPRGHTTFYRFNGQGYETRRVDPLGRVTEKNYDFARNLLRSVVDPLGRKTFFTYDERGNRTSKRDPANNVVVVDYHPHFNKPTRIQDALGRETHVSYTPNGKLRRILNAAGERSFEYDSRGLMTASIDALNRRNELRYDGEGNLLSVTDALDNVSRYAYNSANRLMSATDPLGRTTRYHYDVLDRLTRVEDPAGGITEVTYDPQGRVETVKDPSGIVIQTSTYDKMGRLKSRADSAGRRHVFEYDANGNLVRHIDPKGQVNEYSYDELDRLVHAVDGDGRTTDFTYDAASRLVRVVDSVSRETRYEYDTLDRLTREITDRGVVAYEYNAASELIRRTVNGSEVTTYQYDTAGRVENIDHHGKAARYEYNAAGQIVAKFMPNGLRQSYRYDGAGRLKEILYTSPEGNELDLLEYGYDPAGQRTGRYQRHGETVPETPFVATYDDDNRLLTLNGHDLSYDANGNLVERETEAGLVRYTWDARNRLIAIDGPHGRASFVYDHLGRRIEKTVNGQTVRYLYHGPQAIAELQGNALGAVYHTGLMIDEVLARYAPSGNRTLLADALGSVIAVTDENGSLTARYHYSPYGESQREGDDTGNPLTYTGREDDGTGLYYYRARYYEPSLKRFLSVDPIGLGGGINVHAYVSGNPVRYTDPFGLEVVIQSRPLDMFGGSLGSHTYVTVTTDGNTVTYSSYQNDQGMNEVRRNDPTDHGEDRLATNDSIIVPPPEGFTQEQWDQAVIDAAEELLAEPSLEYKPFGGDGGVTSGNCHTTTQTIMSEAGGQVPPGFNPPGLNPGLHP